MCKFPLKASVEKLMQSFSVKIVKSILFCFQKNYKKSNPMSRTRSRFSLVKAKEDIRRQYT